MYLRPEPPGRLERRERTARTEIATRDEIGPHQIDRAIEVARGGEIESRIAHAGEIEEAVRQRPRGGRLALEEHDSVLRRHQPELAAAEQLLDPKVQAARTNRKSVAANIDQYIVGIAQGGKQVCRRALADVWKERGRGRDRGIARDAGGELGGQRMAGQPRGDDETVRERAAAGAAVAH